MIAFGWSAGDIASAIKLIVHVTKAFKESGGAAEQYQCARDFLTSFRNTLEHIQKYVESNPDDKYTQDISDQLQCIEGPWKRFEAYTNKYEHTLSSNSKASTVGKAPKVVRWTLKELSGEIQKLGQAVESPLQLINQLLSLQIISKVSELANNVPSSQIFVYPNTFKQIVDAIHLAAIPEALSHQIDVFNDTLSGQDCVHDEQLRKLEQLQTSVEVNHKELVAGAQALFVTYRENYRKWIKKLDQSEENSQTLKEAMENQKVAILKIQVLMEQNFVVTKKSLIDLQNLTEEHYKPEAALPVSYQTTTLIQWSSVLLLTLNLAFQATSFFHRGQQASKTNPEDPSTDCKVCQQYEKLHQTKRSHKRSKTSSANPRSVARINTNTKPRISFRAPEAQAWVQEFDRKKLNEVWYCCQCWAGPVSKVLCARCMACEHETCSRCAIQLETKLRLNKLVDPSANTPVEELEDNDNVSKDQDDNDEDEQSDNHEVDPSSGNSGNHGAPDKSDSSPQDEPEDRDPKENLSNTCPPDKSAKSQRKPRFYVPSKLVFKRRYRKVILRRARCLTLPSKTYANALKKICS
ncbi:hypothetical protein EJ08DRAFT_63540 [Tothia fuscella]|uniref:Uncharacterized protein n=1 Tax=Tothia fuscella TaxID=1048955 RepID=A0A9P4NEZ3_9PEZI|nr:hypothetical protein EJ08DRAFT_63540 [Tothia fuscella]